MLKELPDKYKEEGERLCRLWVESDCDISEVVEKHASKEYKKYYFEEIERFEESEKQGLMI